MWRRLALIWVLLMGMGGCATVKKQPQIQFLQEENTQLKNQLQQKDKELSVLEEQLMVTQQLSSRAKVKKTIQIQKSPSVMTPWKIQSALKDAGFYEGPIDGKIGNETKKAIKKFQKANGLLVDGIPGEDTRRKLKKYVK
ncbi:MAG: peptidoglycan-binding protein [Candidatus Omnitrophica bacterium]|nr:peptidoglycan-binding protein [Candidatus Omnitrophota bacterium]